MFFGLWKIYVPRTAMASILPVGKGLLEYRAGLATEREGLGYVQVSQIFAGFDNCNFNCDFSLNFQQQCRYDLFTYFLVEYVCSIVLAFAVKLPQFVSEDFEFY
ncbi:hypothetical protein RJT34_14398 [Clitoria ternatea]|uniref:Uncharacterized protein n=1 Tax=Clitoria ternatea TaxID=43366 RepID=A0AAN9JSF6_CLITE